MKFMNFILSAFFLVSFTALASADPVPKRSADFKGNYQTLIQDQKAPRQVAECIASAYDYVKKNKKYDRLGFTQADISAAKSINKTTKFSKRNPRRISTLIEVSGLARPRSEGTNWDPITLRCGIASGKLRAIELLVNNSAR